MKRKPTEADILMGKQLENLPYLLWWKKEYRFSSGRKWRFDFAFEGPNNWQLYGLEIEGGAFTQGRHTRGVGFIKDMEKYNYATMLGWRVLRFTPSQVLKGEAIAFIKKVLES